jgi:retinol dehydrogenase-14
MGSPEGRGPGIVVLTGTSGGIGHATALALAARGRSVVLVARRKERLDRLAEAIQRVAPETHPSVHPADLSLEAEVRRVAQEIRDAHPRIDALVNNAGAWFHRRAETSEGVERTFALNVLAPVLLTELLRPSLRAAAPARVVMVSSAAHLGYDLELDDLEGRRHYRGFSSYGRSKLALILLTHVLAERYRSDGIVVNALHPGFIRSRFGQNNEGIVGGAMWVLTRIAGRSAEYGAREPVRLATAPEGGQVPGQYFVRGRSARSSAPSYDPAVAARLWAQCAARLRLDAPGERTTLSGPPP